MGCFSSKVKSGLGLTQPSPCREAQQQFTARFMWTSRQQNSQPSTLTRFNDQNCFAIFGAIWTPIRALFLPTSAIRSNLLEFLIYLTEFCKIYLSFLQIYLCFWQIYLSFWKFYEFLSNLSDFLVFCQIYLSFRKII